MKITFLLVERSFLGSLRSAAAELRERHAPELETAIHFLPDVMAGDSWKAVEADARESLAVFAVHVTDEAAAERIGRLLDGPAAQLRVFVPFNCLGTLMRRARLGKLDLSRRRGFMSGFGQLIRRPSGQSSAESFANLTSRVARWLRFAPGRGQDFRAFLQLYSYYLNASPENLRNLLLLVLSRYGGLKATVAPPIEYPTAALYHPEAPGLFAELGEYLAWFHGRPGAPREDAPQVGVVLFRSFVLNRNTAHYDAVIASLERRGLVPLPAVAFALDNRLVQERYFGSAEAILSLTGFGYVGGMGANDAPAAVATLARHDVPYFDAVPLAFQRIEEWQASPTGLNPLQTMMQVAIPELDGATQPVVFGGASAGRDNLVPMEDRVECLCERLTRTVRLRTMPNAEKRIAITLFSFPPNAGTLGTAAYLDVFASLHRLLQRMAAESYRVDGLPDTPEALRQALAGGNAGAHGTPANVAARISTSEYRRAWPWWQEAAACWGPPPGQLNSQGDDLLILGRHFGNIFVGIQPTFGYEGDPLRLLAARGQTPHHGFCAYYAYLQQVWKADAVVHFGTHGSLEFMPGKQVGLSSDCWPDRLIGAVPHVYLYSVGNPSEGTIAKRRSYATLVSYLSPPMSQAGLYKELLGLKDLIETYRRTRDPELLPEIERLAGTLHLGGRAGRIDREASLVGAGEPGR